GAGGAPLQLVPGMRPPAPDAALLGTAHSCRGILSSTHLAREGRMTVTIRRRELLVALGGAAAWPLAARAPQSAMPGVGVLEATTAADTVYGVWGFRDGLKEAGFIDGHNVAIEFGWAENKLDRLPALAADLVRRQVAVIAGQNIAARAAMAATSTI